MRFLILLVTNDVTHADLVNADLYQNKKNKKRESQGLGYIDFLEQACQ